MPNYQLSINYSCYCTVVLPAYCRRKKDKRTVLLKIWEMAAGSILPVPR
jgi:hypothetical protein